LCPSSPWTRPPATPTCCCPRPAPRPAGDEPQEEAPEGPESFSQSPAGGPGDATGPSGSATGPGRPLPAPGAAGQAPAGRGVAGLRGAQASFDDAAATTHLCTFSDAFAETRYPVGGPGVHRDGLNAAPLRLVEL
ncbi:hypothetical protein KIL84_007044, partial [Mauremys mutica]